MKIFCTKRTVNDDMITVDYRFVISEEDIPDATLVATIGWVAEPGWEIIEDDGSHFPTIVETEPSP